jgi:hypothetical protein
LEAVAAVAEIGLLSVHVLRSCLVVVAGNAAVSGAYGGEGYFQLGGGFPIPAGEDLKCPVGHGLGLGCSALGLLATKLGQIGPLAGTCVEPA